jgi:hypothetical protein
MRADQLRMPMHEDIEERDGDILTVNEVAAWLQVSPSWVRLHSKRHRNPFLPSFKVGKYLRFRRSALRHVVKSWERAAGGQLNA